MRPPCPSWPDCLCTDRCDAELSRRSVVSPWQIIAVAAFAIAVGFVFAMALPGVWDLLGLGGW